MDQTGVSCLKRRDTMIPVAPDLGLTETYGTTSVLAIRADEGKLKVEEPVVADKVRSLQVRDSTLVTIHKSVKKEVIDVAAEGVPRMKSAALFEADDVFDPCVSGLVDVCELGVERFAAFTTGEDNRILVVGRLKFDTGRVHFAKIKALSMKSAVKQVEMVIVGYSVVILVRTSKEVHLLKLQRGLVTKLFTFSGGEGWVDFAYATVSFFSDSSVVKLAVIDEVGKFTMFESAVVGDVGEFYEVELMFESIYDPVDLSHFKKLVWLEENRLVLFTRTQLHEYNLGNEKLRCRISAGIWSKLLDFEANNTGDLYYLLTSKEVIVVDVTNGGFRRRFAWKHYLNDTDTSMYVTAVKFYEEELCIVASKQIPVSFVFRFMTDDVRMIDTPSMFVPTTNEPWVSIALVSIEDGFGMLMKVEDAVRACLVDVRDGVSESCMKKVRSVLPMDKGVQFAEGEVAKILDLGKYYKFAGEEIPNSTEITRQIYKKLEQFLGSGCTQMTLFQITCDLHVPRRVENVCKIVEYMIRNNREEHFELFINRESWMTDMRIAERVEATSETLEEHLRELRSRINDEMVVFYLFLSSIEVWKKDETYDIAEAEVRIAAEEEGLGDDVREVLSRFDEDFNVVGIYDSEEEVEESGEVKEVWSIPTVGVSQSQRKRVLPKGAVRDLAETSDSQSESQFSQRVSLTQSQGQSQKRRKKRRGGF